MKRFLAASAALAVLMTVLPAPARAQQGPLTRAGAVALLVEGNPVLRSRAEWFAAHPQPMALFRDTQRTWYTPYLEAAFEAGIVRGNVDRLFRPGAAATSEEAIEMVNRYKVATDPAGRALEALAQASAVQSPTWYSHTLTVAKLYAVAVPERVRIGAPITRDEYAALLGSVGIQNASSIALTIGNPAPVQPVAQNPILVAQAPVTQPANRQPRPTVPTQAQPRPQQPIVQRPAVQQPRPTTPVTSTPRQTGPVPATTTTASSGDRQYASNKAFAITIPAAGIKDLAIIHPSSPSTHNGLLAPLKNGVGHLFSYPGKKGKILIYGHSSSYSYDLSPYTKIFRQINKLNPGDKIYVTYDGTLHVYQVTHESVVPANDMTKVQGGGSEELILYTCWPPDDIKQRYLVHAKPVTTVALR